MKIFTIIGARPQFIKASAMSREIEKHTDVQDFILHTGQHFDANMSEVFFEQMKIPKPDVNLNIHGMTHGAMTGQMLQGIEENLLAEKPDVVLVYGDTNSTLAGALAAAKLHIPVGHVEAGLRSFNMKMPEEINRVLTDHISKWLFCPTADAVSNLENEGVADNHIFRTGDIMYDSAVHFAEFARSPKEELPQQFALCTLHRAENTDNPEILASLVQSLESIAKDLPLVLPLHPRTKKKLDDAGLSLSSAIHCIEPVGYLEMLWLLKHTQIVLTDSGGLQKEAYFFEKACITLREETEWVELTEYGINRICGHDQGKIHAAFQEFRLNKVVFPKALYGDGHSAQTMLNTMLQR